MFLIFQFGGALLALPCQADRWGCEPPQPHLALEKVTTHTCEQLKTTSGCEEFERTHPEFKDLFNDCNPRSTTEISIDCSVKIGGSAFVAFVIATVGPEVAMTALGAWAVYKSVSSPFGPDQDCFYDVEGKRARIEKFNTISSDPRFQLTLDPKFIENVTCTDLQQMLTAKWKIYLLEHKNDPSIYLSKKIDNGLISSGLIESVQDLYKHRACLRPDIAAGLICASVSIAASAGVGVAAAGPNAILNRALRARIERIWPRSAGGTTPVTASTAATLAPSASAGTSIVTTTAVARTTAEVASGSETALASSSTMPTTVATAAKIPEKVAKPHGPKKPIQTEVNGLPKFETALAIPKPTWNGLSSELSEKFPQLQKKMNQIDSRFAELSEKEALWSEREVRGFYKNHFTSKEFSKNPQIFSALDREAYAKVARHLGDNASWKIYVKNLYTDAAEWIAKYGNANEISALSKSGDISERALIAVLFKRAKARGDALGKSKTKDVEEFTQLRAQGVWIDRAFPSQNLHGQFSHLLQMDYVAPLLRSHYNGDHSLFYTFIENQCKQCWTYLFDNAKVPAFHSGGVVHRVLKDVLPIQGKNIYSSP